LKLQQFKFEELENKFLLTTVDKTASKKLNALFCPKIDNSGA